ncbi:uncharacterized protein [Aristolochia californica]|uniref:uncharacterized protein isoform X2 n=1 Tax=Aristolochia californica TaxID=171875 RepID=UPI0035E1F51A
MLGMSYGELFLLLGATAALIGPKDLPKIARMAGRLAGKSIGYVQIARGQFDNILQQSQAQEVHKELQDALAQIDAIRYEMRSLSFMNPGPMTRRLMDGGADTSATNSSPMTQKLMDIGEISPSDTSATNSSPMTQKLMDNGEISPSDTSATNSSPMTQKLMDNGEGAAKELNKELQSVNMASEADSGDPGNLASLHNQAIMYEKLAKLTSPGTNCSSSNENIEKLSEDAGGLSVLPISAKSAGLLLPCKGDMRGSDIMLEAILEAEVAANAKHFVENKIQLE